MKIILLCTLLTSCSSTPSWTNATPQQRAAGDFKFDYDYTDSQQFTNDVNEDVEVVERLKQQMGKD